MHTLSRVWQGLFGRITSLAARKNLRAGDELREQGDFNRAASAYQHAVSLDPGCAAAYHNLGGVLGQLQRWDEAAEAYRLAVGLNPEVQQTYSGWVDCLTRCERWDEAISVCQQVLDHYPDACQPFDWLGDCLLHLDRLDEAVTAYRELVKRRPDAWSAYQKLGQTLMKKQHWEEAVSAFRSAIEQNPEHCTPVDSLGNALMRLKRWQEAAEAYQLADRLNPDNPWHSFKLGEAYKYDGEWQKAMEAFQHCQTLQADLPGLQDRLDEIVPEIEQAQRLLEYCQAHRDSPPARLSEEGSRPRLRVLILSPFPPYPPSGGAIRLYEELKYFGKHHDLVVATFYPSQTDREIRRALDEYCEFTLLLKPDQPFIDKQQELPRNVQQWTTGAMWKSLQQLSTTHFDLVLFNFVYVSPYLKLFENAFTVLEEHNIESELCRQMHLSAQDTRQSHLGETHQDPSQHELLRAYEESVWPRFSLCTTVSEDDRLQILKRCPATQAIVVSNGVDTHAMAPVEYDESGAILFMGHMTYPPNIDAVIYFVEQILPLLWRQDPELRFTIAGRNPTSAVRRLGEDPRIEIIANPEEMREVATGCCMTVVPLRMGSGTRLKILDSFSMALPVVSTSLGCEGLSVIDGKHCLIRDQAETFAEAVLQIRADPELRTKLRMNGRRQVKNQYNWQTIFSTYEQELLTQMRSKLP